jgi:hypothetical protein
MPRVKKKYFSSLYTINPLKGLIYPVEGKKDVKNVLGMIRVHAIGRMFTAIRRILMEPVIFTPVVDRRL